MVAEPIWLDGGGNGDEDGGLAQVLLSAAVVAPLSAETEDGGSRR